MNSYIKLIKILNEIQAKIGNRALVYNTNYYPDKATVFISNSNYVDEFLPGDLLEISSKTEDVISACIEFNKGLNNETDK